MRYFDDGINKISGERSMLLFILQQILPPCFLHRFQFAMGMRFNACFRCVYELYWVKEGKFMATTEQT